MSLPSSPPDRRLRRFARPCGWLIPAALFALTPKCALCLLAYAGLGAALGLGGPEICGATNDPTGHGTVWLAVLGAAIGIAGFLIRRAKPSVSRRDNTSNLLANQPKAE